MFIKISMLCGTVEPLFSGTEDFATRLTSQLNADGHSVTWPNWNDWRASGAPGLYRILGNDATDVVSMQYPTDAFRYGLAPHLLALIGRWPLVVTIHEFSAAHPLRRLSISALTARADAVVMTTEYERKMICQWYPWLARRCHVIPIGATIPPLPWRPSTPPIISHFGQIRPGKGLEMFLECAAISQRLGHDWIFQVVGSSVARHRDYLDTLIQRSGASNIQFTLNIGTGEVAERLAQSTAVLLPFPDGATFRRTSLLAAAGCGAPILTTVSSETPEAMANSVIAVETAADAAAKLAELLSDPARLLDAHEKSSLIAGMTSWDTIGKSYASVFESVLRGRGGRVRQRHMGRDIGIAEGED
ncbi:glycosyltransferase family 4 protein (plasmid) [Skermanella sp. TT6]|uniref:Glycosyltransferase family 4 protein n=1 Tax=Skermanella cutis TaxID=2775420 RepID=A0ABX7BFA9_9PROT|nr:glycosyltransferase family 4 protein [Skermanella sp. TT6]QQP92768.1 glycosyltransferase family 4 protein [Skermanella sp. TT6]